MQYLKNDICKFTPLFKIDFNKKNNIISCVLFKMTDGGYKDFNIYISGIKKLKLFTQQHLPDFKIRLFIDNSIYQDKYIMNSIKKLNFIQVVLYSCPNYIIKSNFHVGLFGSLIRLFPMFDFENNDANLVIISDVDTVSIWRAKYIIEYLNKINKLYDNYFIKIGDLAQDIFYRHNILYKNKINIYSPATKIVSVKKLSNSLITDFIRELSTSDVKNYSYQLIKDSLIKNKKIDSKYVNHKNFIYGIDEYFINQHLSKFLFDENIPFVEYIRWNLFNNIKEAKNDSYMSHDKYKKLMEIMFDYILIETKTTNTQKLDFKEKYQIIEKLFSNEHSYKNYYLLYKAFLYLINNQLYKFIFPTEYYTFLLTDDFFAIYDFEIVIFMNSAEQNIFIKQKKFKNEDILKLKNIIDDKSIKINLFE